MDRGKLDPSRALRSLRTEIDTLFDRFVERPLGAITGQVVPTLDISETDTELTIKADLPGLDQQDIDVSLSGDTLTIRGQKAQEHEEADKTHHLIERSYGSFSRSIRLPTAVQSDKVEATYKKGVLNIVLPKKEPVRADRIEIKGE